MASYLTYDAASVNHEHLEDLVAILAREETPLYSGLQKTKSTNKLHSWTKLNLTTGSDNAQVEAASYTFAAHTAPSLVTNYNQILFKTVSVSKSQQASNPAGFKDEFKEVVRRKMIELKTDIEEALITGTGNTGSAAATARRMTGFINAISTNIETGTATANETLTEDMFNDLLQTIWAAGGRPKDAYMNGAQKRKASAFTSPYTSNVNVDDGRLRGYISVYESDFGIVNLHLDAYMDTDKVLLVDKDNAKVAVFRPMKFEETAHVGSSMDGVIETELTLQFGNEAAHGVIKELST